MKKEIHIKFIRTIVIVCCACMNMNSQNNKIDSLYKVYNLEKHDTSKIDMLNAIAVEWGKINIDSAIIVGKKTVALAERTGIKDRMVKAYYTCGLSHFLKGDYPGAVKQYFKALPIIEKINMVEFQGRLLGAIGNAFMMQTDYEKSLIYYHKAFSLFQKKGLKNAMASTYSNIGLVYAYQSKTEEALFYLKRSLEYREAPNDADKAITYDFIGYAYIIDKNYPEALKYLNTSLELNRKIGSTVRIIDNLRNIGECHLKLENYKLAEKELSESLELSKQCGHINGIEGNSVLLYELYKKKKQFRDAKKFYVEYVKIRDSIYNRENTRNSLQQEIQFEYNKKAAIDSIRGIEERKVTAARFEHEQIQRNVLYSGLVIVGLFALFMVNRFRVISKQKQIIDSQKKIVEEQKFTMEEKQREILDSINYARRIQLAHLPSEQYFVNVLQRLKK